MQCTYIAQHAQKAGQDVVDDGLVFDVSLRLFVLLLLLLLLAGADVAITADRGLPELLLREQSFEVEHNK